MRTNQKAEYWTIPSEISSEMVKEFDRLTNSNRKHYLVVLERFIKRGAEQYVDANGIDSYKSLTWGDGTKLLRALNINMKHGVYIRAGNKTVLDLLCYFTFQQSWKDTLQNFRINESDILKRKSYDSELEANNEYISHQEVELSIATINATTSVDPELISSNDFDANIDTNTIFEKKYNPRLYNYITEYYRIRGEIEDTQSEQKISRLNVELKYVNNKIEFCLRDFFWYSSNRITIPVKYDGEYGNGKFSDDYYNYYLLSKELYFDLLRPKELKRNVKYKSVHGIYSDMLNAATFDDLERIKTSALWDRNIVYKYIAFEMFFSCARVEYKKLEKSTTDKLSEIIQRYLDHLLFVRFSYEFGFINQYQLAAYYHEDMFESINIRLLIRVLTTGLMLKKDWSREGTVFDGTNLSDSLSKFLSSYTCLDE